MIYLITVVVLAIVDLAWVGGIAHSYYQTHLGALLSTQVIWWAIVLFYLLYAVGIVYFVITPALEVRSITRAILTGAFLGLIAFGTYDLTNLATTAGWPTAMSFVDMAWGTAEGAIVAAIVYLIATAVLGM